MKVGVVVSHYHHWIRMLMWYLLSYETKTFIVEMDDELITNYDKEIESKGVEAC